MFVGLRYNLGFWDLRSQDLDWEEERF
jgi:hypothetical protein